MAIISDVFDIELSVKKKTKNFCALDRNQPPPKGGPIEHQTSYKPSA